MLPKGWKNTIVSETCELINGRGFKPHEWSRTGLPIIRIQNLNGSREYNFYNGEFDKKILVHDGELLFAWSGSKGTSFGPHIWHGPDGVLNYHTWKVLPKPSANISFLNQYFRYITSDIENKSHGASALVHTQKGYMENISILLPPLPEQKKIAAILSTWDRAIEGTEKLLSNSQQQKKALMQQLLTGKKRLPGFTGEWKLSTLAACCKPQQWTTISSKDLTFSGFPVYGANGFIGYFSEYNHEEDTVTVTCRGSTCGTVSLIKGPSYITGNSMCLDQVKKNCSHIYLYYYLNHRGLKDIISGSAQPQIVGKAIQKVSVRLPPFPEQKAIAAVLTTADEEIASLESDLSRLRQEKKALMQQLLTGKIRVAV